MTMLTLFRKLVDQQQFEALNHAALDAYQATQDEALLPLLALSFAQLGQQQQARDYCEQALAVVDKLDVDAQVDLAGALCLLWQIDKAVALLVPVIEQQSEHSLALARLAWCRLHQGELETAQLLYETSASLAPHRLPVWTALVRLYLEADDFNSAQTTLDTAIAQLQSQYEHIAELAFTVFSEQCRQLQLAIWIGNQQLTQAEQWLTEQRDLLPEDEWVKLIEHGVMLLASDERLSEAEDMLKQALNHYSANLSLLSQMAELADLQGRQMQAMQLLRRCIRQAKTQGKTEIPYLTRLVSTCLHSMTERAEKAAEHAVSLADELEESDDLNAFQVKQLKLQAKNALAQVKSQQQQYDAAETMFNDLLTENPYFLPALQGLGQQQMQLGHIDKAVALFERVKQVEPAKGYSSLINARRFPDDEETLQRIEKVARGPSLEGKVRSGLLLQLASAYEKRKDYDKAFSLAIEANDSNKKRLSYDAKAHRQQCARIRQAFSKPLYQHRKDCGHDSTLPVFVVGMPRSGTTLVEQILASHSEIFGAGELGVIPSRIQGLNRWERHTGSGRHYPDCIDDLSPEVTHGIAEGIIKELKELAQEDKPDAKFVVDKLPHNFENVGFIKFLFPKAKIISVRRDPRDIAISNFFTDYQAKHGGMGFAYDLEWIGQQLADHNLLMHHWQQTFPNEILEINYENVVEDTETLAKQMLDYIGVDWEETVLSFNELDRPVKTASVWQVRQPIYKTSKAKWKRYENHLAPLIKGTNAKIVWDEIYDMLTLPEPGWLQQGVAHYHAGELAEAEMCFKKMLHHNPDHAAANYMVGLIYCSIGEVQEGIPLFEKALETCPWQKEWRENLIRAYKETGQNDKATELETKHKPKAATENEAEQHDWQAALDEEEFNYD